MAAPFYSSILNSPVGRLGLQVNASKTALVGLAFLSHFAQPKPPSTAVERLAAEELAAYFSHPQHVFRVPIEPTGSPSTSRLASDAGHSLRPSSHLWPNCGANCLCPTRGWWRLWAQSFGAVDTVSPHRCGQPFGRI